MAVANLNPYTSANRTTEAPNSQGKFFSKYLEASTGGVIDPFENFIGGEDQPINKKTDLQKGGGDIVYFTKGGEHISADRVVTYPKWTRTYDLALVFLSRDAKVKPRTIAQDCVLDEFLTEGSDVAVVGYGATDAWGEEYGTTLQEGVTNVEDPDCTDLEGGCNREVSPAGEVGAGGGGVDACFGDSGGPLYLLTDDGAYLLGITSRGYDDAKLPCSEGGIYVRPDAVVAWIEEEIGQELATPSCDGSGDDGLPGEDDVTAWGEDIVSMSYEVGVCGLPLDVGGWGIAVGASGWLVRRRAGNKSRLRPGRPAA